MVVAEVNPHEADAFGLTIYVIEDESVVEGDKR